MTDMYQDDPLSMLLSIHVFFISKIYRQLYIAYTSHTRG